MIKRLFGKTLRKIITGKPGDLPEFWVDALKLGEPIQVTLQHIDKAVYNSVEGSLIGSDETYKMEYVCGNLKHIEQPSWRLRGTLYTPGNVKYSRLSQMKRFLDDQFNQHRPDDCNVVRKVEKIRKDY